MLNNLSIFSDEIRKSFVFHIPHSSKKMPCILDYDLDLLYKEMDLVTDTDTDKIFDIKDIKKVKANFSRLFCDVERLTDDAEELAKV